MSYKFGKKHYNKKCFCGSNKKFKNCCVGKNITIENIVSVDFKNFYEDLCSANKKFKHDCKGTVINAHTISNSNNLKPIMNNKSNVAYIDFYHPLSKNNGVFIKEISQKKASVFKGFCQHHDKFLFEEIDNGLYAENNNSIFWNYYRQIAFELYKSKALYNYNKTINDFLFPAKKVFQAEFQHVNRQTKIKSLDIKDKQYHFDKISKNINTDYSLKENLFFKSYFVLDKPLPFNVSSAWHPLTDYNGETIISVSEYFSNKRFNYVFFTVLYNKHHNPIVLLSCLKEDRKLIKYIKSLYFSKNIVKKIFKLIFSFDNLYFNFDFINNHKNKNKILDYYCEDSILVNFDAYQSDINQKYEFDFDIEIDSKIISKYIDCN